MIATIYIEIPVEVTFSIDPGQKGRFSGPPENCWPEYPACVQDLTFDPKQVLAETHKALYDSDSTVPEQLMEIARSKQDEPE